MILETSAIIAIFRQETGYDALLAAMQRAPSLAVGAPAIVEANLVLSDARCFGRDMEDDLLLWLHHLGVEIVPFDLEHARRACEAARRFGKGRHPAKLNILDTMSYALASLRGEPLLAVGDDFPQTDIPLAQAERGGSDP